MASKWNPFLTPTVEYMWVTQLYIWYTLFELVNVIWSGFYDEKNMNHDTIFRVVNMKIRQQSVK